MRIVLTGGGTGGHVFPLVAIAREIARKTPNADVRFIGPLPFGAELLIREGIVVRRIHAGKFLRYFTPKLFLEIVKVVIGFFQALWELYWFMPDVVFGKGGYGTIPIVTAAILFRIPIIIHESDAVAGTATRFASRFARIVLTSFPETSGLKKYSVRVTGNPVRTTLLNGNRTRAQEHFHLGLKPTILVLGGSQGAVQLNSLMLEIASQLASEAEIIHQAGFANAEEFAQDLAVILEAYPDAMRFYHVVPFLDEAALADAFAVATIVVSRAGAGSIFEIALAGAAAIFLPYPYAARNHQYYNAAAVAQNGGALLFAETNVTPHLLLSNIRQLLHDEQRRQTMRERIRAFAKPNAASEIAESIVLIGKE